VATKTEYKIKRGLTSSSKRKKSDSASRHSFPSHTVLTPRLTATTSLYIPVVTQQNRLSSRSTGAPYLIPMEWDTNRTPWMAASLSQAPPLQAVVRITTNPTIGIF
jgi:hypothetical protein